MMWIHCSACGGGGGGPEKNDKNGAVWCILCVQKHVIINLKINNFKDNKSTTRKNIRHTFLQY